MEEFSFLGAILIFALISYAVLSFPMYALAKKANLDNAIWAFIPILNWLVMLDMIQQRRLSVILVFIPFVNYIFIIYWMYKLFDVFDRPTILYLILYMFVPFAGIIILYYMAISDTVQYRG